MFLVALLTGVAVEGLKLQGGHLWRIVAGLGVASEIILFTTFYSIGKEVDRLKDKMIDYFLYCDKDAEQPSDNETSQEGM